MEEQNSEGYLNPNYATKAPGYQPVQPMADKWALYIFENLGEGNAITNFDTLMSHLRNLQHSPLLKQKNKEVMPVTLQWAIFKAMLFDMNPLHTKTRMQIITTLLYYYQFSTLYLYETNGSVIERFSLSLDDKFMSSPEYYYMLRWGEPNIVSIKSHMTIPKPLDHIFTNVDLVDSFMSHHIQPGYLMRQQSAKNVIKLPAGFTRYESYFRILHKNLTPLPASLETINQERNYQAIQYAADQWAAFIYQNCENKVITDYDSLLIFLDQHNIAKVQGKPNKMPLFTQWAIFKAMIMKKPYIPQVLKFEGDEKFIKHLIWRKERNIRHPLSNSQRMQIIVMLVIYHGFNPSTTRNMRTTASTPGIDFEFTELTKKVKSWSKCFTEITTITELKCSLPELKGEIGEGDIQFDVQFINEHLVTFFKQLHVFRNRSKYSSYVEENWSDYSRFKLPDDTIDGFRKHAIQLLDNYTRVNVPLVGGLISRVKSSNRKHRGLASKMRDKLQKNADGKYNSRKAIVKFLLTEFCNYTQGWDHREAIIPYYDSTISLPSSDATLPLWNYLGSFAKRILHIVSDDVTITSKPEVNQNNNSNNSNNSNTV